MHNIQKQEQDKKFYGSVTVGERGQIVLPAKARRDYGYKSGQKLIVLGDANGVAVVAIDTLVSLLGNSKALLEQLGSLDD